MSDVTEWIDDAALDLKRTFARCADETAKQVVRQCLARFVTGNPRVWWLSLRLPFESYDSTESNLADVIPAGAERVCFIPEDGSVDLPVYELSPEDVELIRQNTPLFEYYVVDISYRWLIIETDHDQFVVCCARGAGA